MVRGMLAKGKLSLKKNSPPRKSNTCRRLVKAYQPEQEETDLQQVTVPGDERNFEANKNEQDVGAEETEEDACALHVVTAEGGSVDDDNAASGNVENPADVVGDLEKAKINKLKRKGKATMDDQDEEGDGFDEDVPLHIRQSQVNISKKKKVYVQKTPVKAAAGLRSTKSKGKGKEKMVDPEYEEVESDSENDTCLPLTKKAKKVFPIIKHWGQLPVLVKAIKKLNDVQRKEVIDIGFGSLLRLEEFEIPWWLVENYHPRTGKIKLPDGDWLDVTEDDVEICLGLPHGPVQIVKHDSQTKMHVVTSWRKHVCAILHSSRNEDVAKKFEECTEWGIFFIQDFIVLVLSCIIAPTQSGASNQSLIRNLECVDQVRTWNWCRFVVKSLIKAKKTWDENPTAYFTGPLFFLTVLYLDRVVLYCQRRVPRAFSTFVGWKAHLVAQREYDEMSYGVIGEGNVESKQVIPQQQNQPARFEHCQNAGVPVLTTKQAFNKALGEDMGFG